MRNWMRAWPTPMFDVDGGGAAGTGASTTEVSAHEETVGASHGELTFTQADVDRIVNERLAKERTTTEKRVEEARTEAEKLAKMDADQRTAHERQAREQALTQREAEITRRELRTQAAEQLAGKKLPTDLLEVLDFTDADKCAASMVAVEKAFRSSVQAEVEARLKGSTPKASGTSKPPAELKTPIDRFNATLGQIFEQKKG